MALAPYQSNFHASYAELVRDVETARHQFVAGRLQEWFALLDETPDISRIIVGFQAGLDFDSWFKESKSTEKGMAGSAEFKWPDSREKRIGMQLLLFRAIAEGKLEAWRVGHTFTYSRNNLDDNSHALVEQVFSPLAGDLMRQINRELERVRDGIPASDRIVPIDHNDDRTLAVTKELDALSEVLTEANDYPDNEEKGQRIAEVAAARRLLDAARVRVQALVELLRPLVAQYANGVKDNLVTLAVSATVAALIALFGRIF